MDVIQEQVEQSREAIEAIESSIETRTLTFTGWTQPDGRDAGERTYVQGPLGMFPVQEFTTQTTAILNSFIQGDMGLRIGELFRGEVKMPTQFDGETVDKVVEDNIELIKAFIKLVEMFPDYQKDIIALSLGVRRSEREWFKECISEPPHRGGLTLEDGFDILIWFIKQNAELIRRVGRGKARELVDTFALEVLNRKPEEETENSSTEEQPKTTEESFDSPGGTPSSTSSPATPVNV